MSSHVAWTDIRAEHVARAGGEEAVEAGKRELLAEVIGHRLAEVRRARGLTQQQVADRMGVTKGRISQIERGKVSGHDVLARYATALGGRLHQASRPPSRPAQPRPGPRSRRGRCGTRSGAVATSAALCTAPSRKLDGPGVPWCLSGLHNASRRAAVLRQPRVGPVGVPEESGWAPDSRTRLGGRWI